MIDCTRFKPMRDLKAYLGNKARQDHEQREARRKAKGKVAKP